MDPQIDDLERASTVAVDTSEENRECEKNHRISMPVRLNDEETKTKKRDEIQMKKRTKRPHIKAAARAETKSRILESQALFDRC